MNLPYQVSCREWHPLLYPLADGRCQIMEKRELAPLMVSCDYVLVDTSLAAYLESLDLPGLQIVDAILYDPRQNQEIRTHKQLRIGERFARDRIEDLDLDGERILLMGEECVFVTPLLKRRLEASPFKYLRFTKGLHEFAAR